MKLYTVLKLTDGQEVYAKVNVDDDDENSVMLSVLDPLTQEEIYNDDGSTTITMVRYSMAAADGPVPISKNQIISLTAMSPQFKEYYKASVHIAKMTYDAFNDKITNMACKMYAHLELIERCKDNPIAFTVADTDSYH